MSSKLRSCVVCHEHFVFPEMTIWALDDGCFTPVCSLQCGKVIESLNRQKNNHEHLHEGSAAVLTLNRFRIAALEKC